MGYACVCVWGGGGQFCTASTLTFFDMERMATFAAVLVLNKRTAPQPDFSYAPYSEVKPGPSRVQVPLPFETEGILLLKRNVETVVVSGVYIY